MYPSAEILGPEEDLTGIVIDDEAANDLDSALTKARRLKQSQAYRRRGGEEEVIARVQEMGQNMEEEEEEEEATLDMGHRQQGTNIMLNATSEFCRSLGEIPTYGQAGNRNEEEEDELLVCTPLLK